MVGKRRSGASTLIEQVMYAETPQEKLLAAENALTFRIIERREGHDRKLNFVELDLTTEEIKWIDLQVGHAFGPSVNLSAESLVENYPRLMLASLVGTAMRSGVDNIFWPEWRRRIVVSEDQAVESTMRDAIPGMLRKSHMKTYEGIELGQNSYVARISLHAGLSTANLEDIVRMHEDRLEGGYTSPGDEAEADFISAEMSANPTTSADLRRFIGAEKVLARFFISRICDFVDYTREDPEWFTTDSFEGTASLPEVMFTELKNFLVHRDDAVQGTERIYTAPALHIDEATGTVQLHLTLPKEQNMVRWAILTGGDRREVVQRSDQSTTDQTHHTLPVTEPSSSIEIELEHAHRSWALDLFTNDRPVIFFSRTSGRRISSHRQVKAEPVVAVAPRGTVFRSGSGASVRTVVSPQAVEHWSGWMIYTVDFSDTDSVTVKFSSGENLNLILDRRDKPSFREAQPIRGLQGLDRRPVYATLPSVVLPAHEAGEWSRRIYYLHPDGTAEDVYREPLVCPVGKEVELFEPSPDAWVGRFEVRLYKNDRFVTSRVYNLAEDVHVDLSFTNDNGEVEFRSPRLGVADTGLTTATFHMGNTGAKGIFLPQGWHKVSSDQLSRGVELSTPHGYMLQCVVTPPRLTFRIDRVDETSAWRSFPDITDTASLDEKGLLAVRIPQKVKDARLTLVDVKRRRPLDQVHLAPRRLHGAEQFIVPVEELLRKLGRAEDIQVVLNWTPHLNAGRYISNKDKREKAKKLADLQREKAGAHAKLARFRQERLLTSATIVRDSITIVPGRSGTTLAVWAWPLHNPSLQPVELAFNGETAQLPESLVRMGPLLLDAKESGFAMFPTPPSRPTDHAILVQQPGYWAPRDEFFDRLSLAFIGNTDPDFETVSPLAADPAVMNRLWATTAALTNLSTQVKNLPEVERIAEVTRDILGTSPRRALESLGDSTVSRSDKPAEFIRTDLVTRRFTTDQTDGDFHDEGWVSLFLEIEDIKYLHSTGQAGTGEYRESWRHLETVGGAQLAKTLSQGWCAGDKHAAVGRAENALLGSEGIAALLGDAPAGTQPWVGEIKRNQALAELYDHREAIEKTGLIRPLQRAALRFEGLVMQHLSDPGVARLLTTQRQKAEELGAAPQSTWAWFPYISMIHALIARQTAHDVIRRDPIEVDLWQWSQLARRVPTLSIYDLLVAEAVVVHHASPALTTK